MSARLFKFPVPLQDRYHVYARRRNVDSVDKFSNRKRRRAFSGAVPVSGSARTSVVGGDHTHFRARHIAKLLVRFLEIPASDLNIALGVSENAARIAGHLPLQDRKSVV